MRILYATDGSEASAAARRFLNALPLPAGTEIRIVSVVVQPPPFGSPMVDPVVGTWAAMEPLMEQEAELADAALAQAQADLQRPGVAITTQARVGDPAWQILAEADEFAADLLVLGSRGLTGVDGFLLGSVARNVAKHSGRPALIAREPKHGVRSVVLASDGSEHARHAAAFAGRFPLPEGAEVVLLHVVRPHTMRSLLPAHREGHVDAATEIDRRQREAAEALLAAARTELGERIPVQTTIRDGDPATEILRCAADHKADLVIAGARGVSLIQGLITGSVADRLLKEAECSVLIVH
jgi:nucleotide-binding universal stress UspA family protein